MLYDKIIHNSRGNIYRVFVNGLFYYCYPDLNKDLSVKWYNYIE